MRMPTAVGLARTTFMRSPPPSAEDCTSAFSNRGPITRPSTSGAIGKLIRFMRKPTTPNTTTTQRLNVLFATANAPISAVKMMSGYRYEYGRRKRSEEHTSELQSRGHLVCRLLLEKKNASTKLPSK